MAQFKIEVVVEGRDLKDRLFAAIAGIVGDDTKVVVSSFREDPSLRAFITEEIKEGLLRHEAGELASGNHD
ncbi:MAG: hypothetical protein AAB933_01290 [Patescibacteria group bacterium]